MKFQISKLTSSAGESLMEVIISVGVLMLIIGPVAGLYITSNRSADTAKKSLVAENLAQEGIELMRIVRDSNLLKFKTKTDVCWLTRPDFIDPNTCQANTLAAGSYVIQNTQNGPLLTLQGAPLTETLDAGSDEVFHMADPFTPYYREVTLALDNLDANPSTDRATIISRVRFKVGSKVKEVAHSITLYAQK